MVRRTLSADADDATKLHSIPRRWRTLPPDARSRGTMSQFVREYLGEHRGGLTRQELKEVIEAQPQFDHFTEQNPKGFYGLVTRLLHAGDIEDHDGLLRASPRVIRHIAELKQSA